VGARFLLAAAIGNLAAASHETLSWGPFSGSYRIHAVRFGSGTSYNTQQSAGIFVTSDVARPTAAGAFTLPSGWRQFHTADPTRTNTADEIALQVLPLLSSTTADTWSPPLDWDFTGDGVHVKAVIHNRSVGGHNYDVALIIERTDAELPEEDITPRTQPDFPLPPPPPTAIGPPPAPAPTPTPLPAPPIAPVLPVFFPAPPPDAMPPIAVDPNDPTASADAVCN